MLKTLLLLLGIGCSSQFYAQGFQVNFQGQKQQGMGGAGTALPQDGAALFFNPGSVSFLKENSVNLAMTPTFANVLFTDASTHQSARTNSPMGTPFSAYAVFRKNEESKYFFGLAVYTPFGSTIQYEDGWIGRFALTKLQLKSIYFQPTFSFKISEKLGLGAGFVYATGNVNLQKDLPILGTDGKYASAELSGKSQGFGMNAGVYYTPSEKLSFGFTYRSQVNMEVADGKADFTVPESLEANFPDGNFASSLPLPQVFTLGVGYKSSEKLEFALDINYVGWKAYDTLAFDYETNTSSLADTKSPRMYENIFAFRGGASYKVSDNFSTRLGLAYGMTPVKDGYVTPETPDGNRINYTGGLSYKFGDHFDIDASVFVTRVQRTDTNLETNLSGTFTTIAVAPGLALIYRFK